VGTCLLKEQTTSTVTDVTSDGGTCLLKEQTTSTITDVTSDGGSSYFRICLKFKNLWELLRFKSLLTSPFIEKRITVMCYAVGRQ
jgi:hypothetical protein